MRRFLVVALALLLAACSKSPDEKLKADLYKGCRDSGGPETTCECVVDEISEKYSKEQLATLYQHPERARGRFAEDSIKATLLCATDPGKSLADLESSEAAQEAGHAAASVEAPQATVTDAAPVPASGSYEEAVARHEAEFGPTSSGTHEEAAPQITQLLPTDCDLDCATTHYQEADKDLNATYKDVMAQLPDDKKTELRNEQRAWIKDKESKCAFPSEAAEMSCKAEMTLQRVQYVRSWL